MALSGTIHHFAQHHTLTFLRITIGIIFLSAGLHRIFFFSIAYQNFLELGIKFVMPLLVVTILIEIVCGFLLIINRFIIPASMTIGITLIFAIILSFLNSKPEFFHNINELFILTVTPTNILLHVTYLVGVITLLLYGLSKDSKN